MPTKKAILFPGQGSQYRGMGKKLFPKYAEITKIASTILGYDLEELCLKDPNRELVKTQFTQPALYVVNYFKYLEEKTQPDFFIGHSLGEYSALLAAGAFDFETGLKLVQKRGALMAAASGGGMAAVLGLSTAEVRQKLAEGGYDDIDIANYNTPTQIVLSGKKAGIDQVLKGFAAQDIKIIPLKVSAPFHSRYMQPAVEQFAAFLKEFSFQKLITPVIANVTARPYKDGEIADLLSQQIASSVQWTDGIRYLMGQNVNDFKELGRGVLTRMADEIRKNCSPIKVASNESSKIQNRVIIKQKIAQTKEIAPHPINNLVHKEQQQSLATKLGSADFRKAYNIPYSYVAGTLDQSPASRRLVIRMAKAGMLAYLGTAQMNIEEIAQHLTAIQKEIGFNQTYGMGLTHQSTDSDLEMQIIQLYLQKGSRNIEATAFTRLTKALVYFHVAGLRDCLLYTSDAADE